VPNAFNKLDILEIGIDVKGLGKKLRWICLCHSDEDVHWTQIRVFIILVGNLLDSNQKILVGSLVSW